MKKKKLLIFIIAFIIIATLITISVISRNRMKPIKVDAVEVKLQDFVREVSANGSITSKESSSIYASVSAAVDAVYVEEGDYVEKGELLIVLDNENLENNLISCRNAIANARMSVRAELLNLRSAFSSAKTNLDQTEREYNRTLELHKIGSVSDEELKLAQEQLTISQANYDSSRQKLNFREGRSLTDNRKGDFKKDSQIVESSPEVQKALSDYDISKRSKKYYEIRSESSGTLTSLNVDEGSVVELGVLMAQIHNTSQLIVDALIDEVDLSYIKTGQSVTITSDSFIGTEIQGIVSRIAPIIKKTGDSRVCEIEVDILDNPDGIARIGASASIFITVDEHFQQPAIPVEAYFIEENKNYIFKLLPISEENEGNAAYYSVEKTEIKTGILGIENIEVTSGLAEGDLILLGRFPGVEDKSEVIINK